MSEQSPEEHNTNPFKGPLTEEEREQIKFLITTLMRFLIAVIIAAGIMGLVVTVLD